MELKTRFELSAALQKWREELAVQPDLTAENRRELETHLSDTVAELRRGGLNEEESFWLARRRVGQLKEVGEEFAKVETAGFVRRWVLGIAIVLYLWGLWDNMSQTILISIVSRTTLTTRDMHIYQGIHFLLNMVVVLLGVYLARSRFQAKLMRWCSMIRSRGRLFAVGSFLLIKVGYVAVLCWEVRKSMSMYPQEIFTILFGGEFVWAAFLLGIILWLLPTGKSPALKNA